MASCIHVKITTTTTTTGVVAIGFGLSNSVQAYGTPAVFPFDQEPDGDIAFIPSVPPRCRMQWSGTPVASSADASRFRYRDEPVLPYFTFGHWTCVLVTIAISPEVKGGIQNLLMLGGGHLRVYTADGS